MTLETNHQDVKMIAPTTRRVSRRRVSRRRVSCRRPSQSRRSDQNRPLEGRSTDFNRETPAGLRRIDEILPSILDRLNIDVADAAGIKSVECIVSPNESPVVNVHHERDGSSGVDSALVAPALVAPSLAAPVLAESTLAEPPQQLMLF